mgnify:CR=1 FL=1
MCKPIFKIVDGQNIEKMNNFSNFFSILKILNKSLLDKFTRNVFLGPHGKTCTATNFLGNGIPDYPVTGGSNSMFNITGSTKTSITQLWFADGNNYLIGHYSHTTD